MYGNWQIMCSLLQAFAALRLDSGEWVRYEAKPDARFTNPLLRCCKQCWSPSRCRSRIVASPSEPKGRPKLFHFPVPPLFALKDKDVEPSHTTAPGLACRLYANGSECHPRSRFGLRFQKRDGMSEIRMRAAERATPVAAVIAALSTLACCLPLGFLGAIGLAGTSLWLQAARPWLLACAAILLVLGFIQLYVRRNQCQRRSPLSIAMFWLAAVMVLLVILFPQLIASLIVG